MSILTGQYSCLESLEPCRPFTFSEVQIATQNFDESLVIGHGGFGKVYKGTIPNGESVWDVAIKRLEANSNQGAVEFLAEIEMLSKLRHCHLVYLIGYCNEGQEMILVYQYMPHGTLEHHLHTRGTPLSWIRRLKICIGAARGLDYLHTGAGVKHGVIHRDVKSSNILLDGSWAAKISDFGLSKVAPRNQPRTSVSTLVKGTFGYLDPDYVLTGRLTRKSDVYAFGVIMFEVLCRKQAVDRSLDEEQWNLARWAQESIKEGTLSQIVDPTLRGKISAKCLKEFARVADWCLQSHPKQRPTMGEVVIALESILALQDKSNNTWQSGVTIFGRQVPKLTFTSNTENSVGSKPLKSLETYLNTVGGSKRRLRRFDFDTILDATENLSEANIISQQAYAYIYKGSLENGQDIEILERGSGYQYIMNEASTLVNLEHENLVKLFGYCITRVKVYLLYEFAPYASLYDLIHDHWRAPLNWDERYKILLGVARALAYLHKEAPIRVIHRDLKPKHILLYENMVPRLSAFWYSRCSAIKDPDSITVFRVHGTRGHMAPEIVSNGPLSTKVDVFSFGVLVLEIVSGRDANYESLRTDISLEHRVWRNWLEGNLANIIDVRIVGDPSLMTRFIRIGLLCIQEEATDRPTMDEVVVMLLGRASLALPIPKVPSWVVEMNLDDTEDVSFEDYNDYVSFEDYNDYSSDELVHGR
ncbi:hypothetical protein OSB04_005328 [Centaurea solstitialis]|uniref:Protein kinase domain-containing protein n=1 Tax=Centaurea solstitialis TaxID=347529 RepID=A0AA38U0G4_9ASTR|nr:hypothetical protein OSB04_005328 [Centaurea solstitialis]